MNALARGRKTNLVEITTDDAADIIRLRNDPKINKNLSSTRTTSVEEQKNWISKNISGNDGVYFKITDLDGQFYGTISLYSVVGNKAEFGRYICENSLLAIEAEYLLLKHGFERMQLDSIYCRTVAENIKVWKQHYKYGFRDTRTEENKETGRVLKVQELTRSAFEKFDYGFIFDLLNNF